MSERVNLLELHKDELEENCGKPLCEKNVQELMNEIRELAKKYHVGVEYTWETWRTHWGTKKCTHNVKFDFVEDLENLENAD